MQFKFLALASLFASSIAAPVLEFGKRTDDATPWDIKSFRRNCTDPNICTYYLAIDVGSEKHFLCTITDKAQPATTHAWYAKRCDESADWELSWGYDGVKNFAVMTLVFKPNATRAFFGYDYPNVGLPVISYVEQAAVPLHF